MTPEIETLLSVARRAEAGMERAEAERDVARAEARLAEAKLQRANEEIGSLRRQLEWAGVEIRSLKRIDELLLGDGQ